MIRKVVALFMRFFVKLYFKLDKESYWYCIGTFGLWLDRNRWSSKKYDELVRAEEQGLLLRLPCPIGTTVYNTTWWDDITEKVDVDGKTFYRIVHKHKVSKSTFSLGDVYDFGKTVFLTKAEAEQKLKEIESDCNETN